jgi:hypothetical protein
MKYKVNQNNNLFEVLEIPTKQVLKSFPNREDARSMVRMLNFGGGFDGFTPTFFLKNVEIKLTDN